MNTFHIFRRSLATTFLMAGAMMLQAQDQVILSSIRQEVDRNFSQLRIENLKAPFYIRYMVYDNHTLNVGASLGALQYSSEYTQRLGNPTLLVGNYEQNNSNYLTRSIYYGWDSYPQRVTLENDPQGIATAVWRDLDKSYKRAAESYEAKQGALHQQNLSQEELALADYQPADPVSIYVERPRMNMDKAYWEEFARKASALLIKYPEIHSSSVEITVGNQMLYYYDTNHSQFTLPLPYYMIKLALSTTTEDGQAISDELYFEHPTFEQLPDLNTYLATCEDFIAYFIELKNAPLIDEAYTGPVLLEKMALAEAFYQHFFDPSLIAKRKSVVHKDLERSSSSAGKGNELEMMTNKKIISRSLTIKSLTGTDSYKGTKLDGYYPVDAEGVVPDKELLLVENGVLRNMLNGRTPTLKNKRSNGHARYNTSRRFTAVSPGNLQLISNDTYRPEEMKQKLLNAAREEDLEYAYLVRRLRKNSPIAVYRVYQDGREELVRGVSLPDFTLRSFKRVLGAADTDYFYNTHFGSLVTYIVPESLLIEELDVMRDNNLSLKTPYIVPQPEATPVKPEKKKKK